MGYSETKRVTKKLTQLVEDSKNSKDLQEIREKLRIFESIHVGYCKGKIGATEKNCCVYPCKCDLYAELQRKRIYGEAERLASLCNYSLNLLP